MSIFSDSFLAAHSSNLPVESLPLLRQQLDALDESQKGFVLATDMKNPLLSLVLSLFLGSFGIDRFYIGDIGLGIAKLCLSWLTFGIWQLVDCFLIMGATKRKNLQTLQSILNQTTQYQPFQF